jgi:hypothetical protein
MSTSSAETSRVSLAPPAGSWINPTDNWWTQHREAPLNWLALGLLLAAWNTADDAAAVRAPRRPAALRGYPFVSVRAAALHTWGDARDR